MLYCLHNVLGTRNTSQKVTNPAVLTAVPGAAISFPFVAYLATRADGFTAIGTALMGRLSTEHTAMRCE